MKTKLFRVLIPLCFFIGMAAVIHYFPFRAPEDKLIIEKILRCEEVDPNSKRVITDKETIRQFTYAVYIAKENADDGKRADLSYRFTLAGTYYYLWFSNRNQIAKLAKRPYKKITYTVEGDLAKELLEIVNEAYEKDK